MHINTSVPYTERAFVAKLLKIWSGAPHAFGLVDTLARQKEVGFSFNIADRCPVGCDCYWRAMGRVPEMSDEEVISFFHARKAEGKMLATIIGGEPYVRRNLLPKVTPIMPANWVVTSGTTPLMVLPRTTHFISIDGKDAATHDYVRRMPGLYNRILQHMRKVRAEGSFPAFIHSVLNQANYKQAGDILRVWEDNGLADGVSFSLMTPISGLADASFALTPEQRAWVVEDLANQKKRFGSFLVMTRDMIESYELDRVRKQTPQTCVTAQRVASYDASGARIPQCIFSEKGNCSECGCVITPALAAALKFPPKLDIVALLARLYTP